MKKLIVLCLLMPACSHSAPVPKEQALANLKTQAGQMCAAVTTKDISALADFTHPKVVEAVGGRQKFIDAVNAVGASGMTIQSVEISSYPTEWKDAGSDFYAVLGKVTKITAPNGQKMKMTGSLLAISSDRGKTWKFVEGTERGKIVSMFPKLPADLTLPVSSGLSPDE